MTRQNHEKDEEHTQEASPCRSGEEGMPCCDILENMTDGVLMVDIM
ncbi:MAG: hypothetical protein NTZ57_00270 [Deltaproteobacteria bacterium]|nr:hypothetical protein [Deltaproteobacteria bacterium]